MQEVVRRMPNGLDSFGPGRHVEALLKERSAEYGNVWESALLVSEPDSINRAGSGACPSDGSGAQSSTYAAGEWVTCYQPASATVDAAYVCGNAGCIKLFDPSADLTLARRNSNEALYFGAAVAAIFSLFWLCMWWQNGFSCRSFMCGDDEEDSDDEEEAK